MLFSNSENSVPTFIFNFFSVFVYCHVEIEWEKGEDFSAL